MAYKSKFTGKQIDDYLDSIGTKQDKLVDGVNIATINGQSLTNGGDVTIEAGSIISESDIAAMGFTKNTGTYSKPTNGIPASDLESDVQNKLNKVDSLNAGMEDTDETVEDVVALSGATPVVDHGTSDTTFTLTSGVIHRWGIVSSLTLTVPEDAAGIANNYKVVFVTDADFTLSLPFNLRWEGGQIPVFEEGVMYEFNIENGRIAFSSFGEELIELDWIENTTSYDYIETDITLKVDDTGMEASAILYQAQDAAAAVAGVSETNWALCVFRSDGIGAVNWGTTRIKGTEYTKGEVYNFSLSNTPLVNKPSAAVRVFQAGGTNPYPGHQRIFYARILGADGTPRVNLVPAKKGKNYGVYDKCSGVFYASKSGKVTGGYNE